MNLCSPIIKLGLHLLSAYPLISMPQVLWPITNGPGATCEEKLRGRGPWAINNGTTAMAAERAQNLQDTFLNHVRKSKVPLTIFLVNGVKLQGVVTWFDNFCVLLRRDGHSQLVYKHAIS